MATTSTSSLNVAVAESFASATATASLPNSAQQASRTRVRNQRRTTSPVPGFCDGQPHGTAAWLCPRLHRRPAASGRRPPARWRLSGVHRDRQRCPRRPARPRPAPDQLRPGDTLVVWRLDRLGRSLRHLVDSVTGLADRGLGFLAARMRHADGWPDLARPTILACPTVIRFSSGPGGTRTPDRSLGASCRSPAPVSAASPASAR